MTKKNLQSLVIECLKEYLTEKPYHSNKENIMKKSQLKAIVNEVVRQCVKEAGPQYKVRDGRSYVEQPGKVNRAREIQDDPTINEVAPEGWEGTVKSMKKEPKIDNPWALAHWMKGKGYTSHKENAVPGENSEGEEQPYDEQEEIELLKQMAQILIRLLQMHKGMEEPEEEEETPETPETPPPAEEKGEEEEKELDESNHKVQTRSYKTVKDVPQDPENIRDPKVPS